MVYKLLLSGYRPAFTIVTFDPSAGTIKLVSESPAPKAASWIEPGKTDPKLTNSSGSHVFYTTGKSSSDGQGGEGFRTDKDGNKGFMVSLEVKGDEVRITGQKETFGGPAHIHIMKDRSGVIASNYAGSPGGSIVFYPTDSKDHTFVADSKAEVLHFPYVYQGGRPQNPKRQDIPHPHQVVEGLNGTLFVPDLGNDRIWLCQRQKGSGLEIKGYLQAPEGCGPRHAVISEDGTRLHVLTELQNTVLAYTLDPNESYSLTHPMPESSALIAPPSLPKSHVLYPNAAELLQHPVHKSTFYASNRLELHIRDEDPSYPNEPPTGDAVGIVRYGGAKPTVDWLVTGCDSIRGMMLSPDGKYLGLAGKDGGGVEIYEVSGGEGEVLKLAAKDAELNQGATFVWL